MIVAGIDVGTTTISGVLIDTDAKKVLASQTIPGRAAVPAAYIWENTQNPEIILQICREILQQFSARSSKIDGLGITGQMHGIVYLDASGQATGDLVTWQDERGNQEFKDGKSYCEYLQSISGYPTATGYGLATHFYNLQNDRVPENSVKISTIADYVAARLCQYNVPVMHASNAAGFGFFDIHRMDFDRKALALAEIDGEILPDVIAEEKVIGFTEEGIAVCIPIGDNQASVIGSVNSECNLLVNIGTSSQLSLISKRMIEVDSLECRPYINGACLLVGSALCGGSAYQLIRDFFKELLKWYEIPSDDDLYEKMEAAARKAKEDGQPLVVDTRFRGSRKCPDLRGSIRNIGIENMTPGHLVLGVMRGICNEMKAFYDEIPQDLKTSAQLVAGGNAVRKNATLRNILSQTFDREVLVPLHREEAALGAAVLTAWQVGGGKDLAEFQKMVRYQVVSE